MAPSSSWHSLCFLASILLSTTRADLISGQTAFSDKILPFLYDDASTNDCTSALGVSMAFALVYPSMVNNEAKRETQTVFGFPEENTQQLVWADTESALEEIHNGTCVFAGDEIGNCKPHYPKLVISNSVWLNSAQTTNPNYTSIVQDHVQEIEFANAESGGLVNTWVNTSTRGLIESIVDDGPLSGVQLVAINTIYLKAQWSTPFKPMFTSRDLFYTTPTRTAVTQEDALFLHKVEIMPYAQTKTHQVVSLPFISENDSLTMTIALPFVENTGGLMSSDEMAQLELQATAVALALPKFTFASTYSDSLKAALMNVGLNAPFQGGLCIYDGNCDTSIDKIIQKTFIALDEEGVEAAAVTAIVGRNLPFYPDGSMEFLADHPFQFFIHDTSTNVVLFEGRVVMPEAEGEPFLTNVSHTRSGELWMNTFRVNVQQLELPPTVVDTSANETMAPAAVVVETPTMAPVIPVTNQTTPMEPVMNQTDRVIPPVTSTTTPTSSPLATTAPVIPEQLPKEAQSSATSVYVNIMTVLGAIIPLFFL